eukprot:1161937-Pelagomonas_calceolata.AAC.2
MLLSNIDQWHLHKPYCICILVETSTQKVSILFLKLVTCAIKAEVAKLMGADQRWTGGASDDCERTKI